MFKAKKLRSNKAGFTLIEVVLVLAIGGLIFLLAFIAFGQATKNRRDTQRRSDAARVISEIENYKGDSNSAVLTSANIGANFIAPYLAGDATNLTFVSNGITYTINYGTTVTGAAATASTASMAVSGSAKCSGNGAVVSSAGDYAVLVKLEKGTICKDNQ
jgi:prepilin-type N-terminal cleavage/methylation domain-containing protein